MITIAKSVIIKTDPIYERMIPILFYEIWLLASGMTLVISLISILRNTVSITRSCCWSACLPVADCALNPEAPEQARAREAPHLRSPLRGIKARCRPRGLQADSRRCWRSRQEGWCWSRHWGGWIPWWFRQRSEAASVRSYIIKFKQTKFTTCAFLLLAS